MKSVANEISKYGRGHITVNRFLRATWVGGSAGVVGGGAFEYARSQWTDAEKLRNRRLMATYNVRTYPFRQS